MCNPHRRRFIARLATGGLLLTPLAAALSGCGTGDKWPEGIQAIVWDRDTCSRCNMTISDRRFAAQLRGGPKNTAFKFDDIGCLIFWLEEKREQFPWMADEATRMWVAGFDSRSREEMIWHDPRKVRYVARSSPMGYNSAAIGTAAEAESMGYDEVRRQILARGR